jgi:ribosomal protein L44E
MASGMALGVNTIHGLMRMATVVLKCCAEHTMHRSPRLKQLPEHKLAAKRRQQKQKLRSRRGVS